MQKFEIITQPAVEPVTLTEAKTSVGQGADNSIHDTMISGMIVSARRLCEKITGISFVYTTWRMVLERFPMAGDFNQWGSYNGGALLLPRGPVVYIPAGGSYAYELPRVRYYDGTGTLQTLVRGTHWEDDFLSNPPRLQLMPQAYWPMTQVGRANPVEVDWVAGFGPDAASVPEEIKLAIKMLVGHWYQQREPVGQVGGIVEYHLKTLLSVIHSGHYP